MSEKQKRAVDPVAVLVACGIVVVTGALPCPVTVLGVLVALVLVGLTSARGAVLIGIVFGAIAFGVIVPFLSSVKEKGNRSNCKNNIKQLGLALILYRDNQGDGEAFPAHDGADFLVALYATQVTTEPDLYLCPQVGIYRPDYGCFINWGEVDGNEDGALLRLGQTPPLACSYAGRRNRDQSRYPGLFTTRDAAETVTASDDSEGARLFNHGDACVMLFADGHVEEVSTDDSRLQGATRVGQPGTILEPLAN